MRIVKIAKKGINSVEVCFDDDQSLVLSYEIFLKNGLRKSDEISESHFLFLKNEDEKYQIKRKSYNYLARRLHAEKELRLKLLKNKYDINFINEVLDELRNLNYLDDERFSREFAEEKNRKAWGKNKIKAALIGKGIDRKVISKVLEQETDITSEYEKAFELAKKKLQILSGKNIDSLKLKQKLNAFLFSKGFDFDIIKEVIDNLNLPSGND
jgi:regulatory protein